MPRIDSHQHFWRYNLDDFGWINDDMAVLRRDFFPEHLKPELDSAQIDGCIAVQAPQTLAENDFLLGLADQNPFIFGVVGWLDLASRNLPSQLETYANQPKFVGVRHIVQAEPPGFLLNPAFIQGVKALKSRNLVYDILVHAPQLPEAVEFVEQLPDQPFVLDHIAKPQIHASAWEPWATQIKALAQHQNVACKLSGMTFEADWKTWSPETLRPYIHHVLDCFGPDRCLFGSDWPVLLPAGTYKATVEALESNLSHLTETERSNIIGNNAARIYNLASG